MENKKCRIYWILSVIGVLAPVDILVILMSGVFTWFFMLLAVRDKKKPLTTGGNNE